MKQEKTYIKLNNPEEIQLLASDPNTSVYLSASAGTGKTKVLTDRYLRFLLQGVEPKKILCLTFTNAAAAEMRRRIADKIEYWSLCDIKLLEQELKALTGRLTSGLTQKARNLYKYFIAEIDNTKIQTIHSFCIEILKRNSNYQDAYFSYDIIETSHKRNLFRSAVDKVIENAKKQDAFLLSLLNRLMELYDYDRLLEIISSILSSKIKFIKYLANINDSEHLKQLIYQNHQADCNISSDEIARKVLDIQEMQKIMEVIPALKEAGENLGDALEQNIHDFHKYKNLYLKADGEPFVRLVKAATVKKYPNIFEILKNEQERVYQYNEEYKKYLSSELCFAVTMVAKKVFEELESAKSLQQLFEYDDLIIRSIDLLLNSDEAYWILYKLDLAIDHILVDEAQDLSQPQWELIKLISEEFFAGQGAKENNRTIFIVGDFKQSIYSFQGAEPKEFEEARSYFAHKVTSALKPWKELNMMTSFRSTAPILKFIDDLLSENFSSYLNYTNHIPFRTGDGYVEMLPLIAKPQNQNQNSGWKIPKYEESIQDNPQKILAQDIASRIKTWLSNKRAILGSLKTIEPQDVMILLRKRSDFIDYLVAELKHRKIPVIDYQKSALQQNLIIQDLLSILKFINLQADDFNLACLLKSPIIGITEEKLFELCYNRETTLWKKVELELPEPHNYLSTLISRSQNLSLYQFINQIMFSDQKYSNLVAKYGDNAHEMIYLFLEAIIKFENQSFCSSPYEEFVEWFKDYQTECISLLSQGKVRITTIHGAKGLQSPIVFLADSASSEQTPHENIFWDNEGNLFFSAYSEFDCKKLKDIKLLCNQKLSKENYRLLYVALTRAEDEVYICGWENNKLKESWYEFMKKSIL